MPFDIWHAARPRGDLEEEEEQGEHRRTYGRVVAELGEKLGDIFSGARPRQTGDQTGMPT